MTYPTDALLHGAQPEQDTAEGGGPGTVFDWSKGETATPEIVVNAARQCCQPNLQHFRQP